MSDTSFKQSPVSAAVWPWNKTKDPDEERWALARIRRNAVLEFLILMALGALFGFLLRQRIAAFIVYVVGIWLLISGLFIPKAFVAMQKLAARFGTWVGQVLTWALLAPFFYLCFLPGHLLIRLFRRDPLRTKFPSDEPTYWSPRRPISGPEHFTRQY